MKLGLKKQNECPQTGIPIRIRGTIAHMHRTHRPWIAIALMAISLSLASCKSDADAPPAPTMPASWSVKADQTYQHNQREFLEVEGRLGGRLQALRITAYEVGGNSVRLHTIVPKDSGEGDKVFRVLASQKPMWSFLRKGDVLYEFAGPESAETEITNAKDLLSR